jgi:DNA-binding Lrp family transcriptional regulator
MAIDKIIQELEIRTSAADKNLDDVIKRLNVLEKEFGDVERKSKKGFKGAEKPVNNLNDTVKRLGQTIATVFAAEKIIQFTKSSIDAASDLNETISKTEQIFGDASKEVIAFAENAAAKLGQSKTQAMDAASTFATFGKSAGLSGTELANFSTDLVTLSADLASFNNTTPEEAIMAIGAALRGESEPIRRYGVLLDDASLRQEALALGIVETTKQALTPQQKVLAAQAAIFKQTGDAQGDFARTSDGVANQQRILQATFQDLQAEIGQKLLPAFNKLLKGTVDFLSNLDADTVFEMAKAAAKLVAVFGAFKLGKLISSFRTLNLTMAANPVGAVLSALTALAAFLPDIIDAFDGVSETQKAIKEAGDKATESLIKEKVELNELATALKTTNPESKERAELLDEFNKLAGTNLQNLEDETANYYQLQAAVNAANNEFDRRITLAAQEAMAQKAKELQLEAQVKQEQIIRKLQEQGISKEEALRRAEKARALQGLQTTTTFGAAATAVDLYNEYLSSDGGLINSLAEMVQQEEEATAELQLLNDTFQDTGKKIKEIDFGAIGKEFKLTGEQVKKLTDESKKLGLTEPEVRNLARTLAGKGTKKEPTLAGAFEALNKEASDLKANLMEAIAQGNMADAKAYAASLGEVEGKLRNISSIAKGIMGELDFDISPEEEGQLNIAPDIDFEALAKEFDIPINKVKELGDAYQETMAKQDEMFEKALNQSKGFEEQKQKQISLESGLQEGMQRTSELTGMLMTLAANRGGAYADFAKQLALANLAVNKAQAISAAIAGATAAAAAKGPGAPFLIAGYIASMIATVVSGFAEIDSIMNTPQPQPPQFFEGTDYLTRNGAPAGKDTIPAMLNEGEAVIPTADNAKYPGLAKSWINGDLDNYIYRNWVAPALSEAEAKKNESMADNLAKSIAMNIKGGFDDYRLYRTNRQGNSLLAQIADNTRPRMNKKRRYN